MSYYELPENDRPPEEIWLDPEALAGHFETVRTRYRDKSEGGWQPVEGSDMQENMSDEVRAIKHAR